MQEQQEARLSLSSSEEENSTTSTTKMANEYSPPDFDFSVPCRGFKSSFARSLSTSFSGDIWSSKSNNNNKNCCKSLEFNIITTSQSKQKVNTYAQRISNRNLAAKKDCPPLMPQRLSCAIGTLAASRVISNKSNHNPINDDDDENDIASKTHLLAIQPIQTSSAFTSTQRRIVPPVGRKSACEMQQLQRTFHRTPATSTHFIRHHPTTERKNVTNDATLNAAADIKPLRIGGCFSRSINSIRSKVDRSNNNIYEHGYHQQQNQNNNNNNDGDVNGDNGEDCRCLGDHVEQNYISCNHGSTINAENEITKVAIPNLESNPASSSPALPPKKQQMNQSHQSRSFRPTVCSSPVFEPTNERQEKCKADLDNVILQNEIHTLRWQLKQMDTRCEMQRAVLEEMARFLDRYQTHFQRKSHEQMRIGLEQIPRSKSLFHVNGIDSGRSSSNSCTSTTGNSNQNNTSSDTVTFDSNYLRMRSSTNLIETNDGNVAPLAPIKSSFQTDTNSYSTFKDYTWRRSPKKPTCNRPPGSNPLTMDEVDTKLSQEAFRLLRTIQNLLNGTIQQPLNGGRIVKAPSSISILTLQNSPIDCNSIDSSNELRIVDDIKTESQSKSIIKTKNCESTGVVINATAKSASTISNSIVPVTADMDFLRSDDFRDSRLSMRSCTDSSVHSLTSSSTDEDATLSLYHQNGPPGSLLTPKQLQQQQINIARQRQRQRQPLLASTTEDESGFSSISSFQEIGVPISNPPAKTKLPISADLRLQRSWNNNASNPEDSVLWV